MSWEAKIHIHPQKNTLAELYLFYVLLILDGLSDLSYIPQHIYYFHQQDHSVKLRGKRSNSTAVLKILQSTQHNRRHI